VSTPNLPSRLRSRISEIWESFPARQRNLVAGISLGLLFVGLLALAYTAYDHIDTLESNNAAMHRALRDIEKKRGAYVAAKARERALESRIGNNPLQLSGFVEQLGKEVGIEIRETNPRSAETLGKKYIQQSVDLRISKVGLEPLLRFLRRIETYQQNLVITTEISIRARDDKHQDFEVDMTVSTYEPAPKALKKTEVKSEPKGDADKEAP
jgi:type II secretory pathway component PulM